MEDQEEQLHHLTAVSELATARTSQVKEMSLDLGESANEFPWKKRILASTVFVAIQPILTLQYSLKKVCLALCKQLPKSTLPGSMHWKAD